MIFLERRYTIGLDDSHFASGGQPEPGWVLKLLCTDTCTTSHWDPGENGRVPPGCDEYFSPLDCPTNRCRWGIDPSLPEIDYHGLKLPNTQGNSVNACIPKKFCIVGCEQNSPMSLTCESQRIVELAHLPQTPVVQLRLVCPFWW
jgi:hypothetical protein